jgi:RNA polymerase sigma factor (sigma-70 family)
MTNPKKSKSIEQKQFKFSAEVCRLLLPNDSQGTAFLRFLRHYINKWHIKFVDPFDVLLEGIERGLVFIEQTNQPITKAEAWLRQTCLNILKDKIKQSIKDEKLVQNSIVFHSVHTSHTENPLVKAELLEQIETLQKAFQQLPSSDQDILRLRFYGEKTYQQIQKTYESLDGQIIHITALRKRESRALRRLKKLFVKLYQQQVDTMS